MYIYSEKLKIKFDYNKRFGKKFLPIQTASQSLIKVILFVSSREEICRKVDSLFNISPYE